MPAPRPALFDLPNWTRLRVRGADAVKFLQNLCTNDLVGAEHGCEAFFCNEKARVLGHGWLCKIGPEEVDFVGGPGQGGPLAAHLSKYLLVEDAEVKDRTGDFATRFLSGAAPGGDVPPLELFETWCGVAASVTRLDLLGEPGYLLTAEPGAADALAALAPGVPPGDAAAFEARRIAAKLPLVGLDLTEKNLAPEADRPWAISDKKGCYLGQEPIARIRALGHVNKLLRGLSLPAATPPPPSGTVLTAEGKEVGVVTSAAGGAALAFVKRKWAEPGTAVTVGDLTATVF